MNHFRTVVLVLILGPLLGVVAPVSANEGRTPARYMGAHIGGGLLGGTGFLSYGGYDEELPSVMVGAFARVSTVLQLLDVQLEYQYRQHALVVQQERAQVKGHAISISTNAHPFFFNILRNNRWWYIVSGVYIQVGGGVERVSIQSGPLDVDRVEWAPIAYGGVGMDIPLDDPEDGGGFWLGFTYRYKAVFMEVDLGRGSDVNAHLLLVLLGYRSNDLNFARLKRPPELEFH